MSTNQPTFEQAINAAMLWCNAWEEGDEVIVDSIYYRDFPSIQPNEDFREINFNLIPEGQLKRCLINIQNQNFEIAKLSPQCCEFAMVNPRNQGLQAQYSWMAVAEQKNGNAPLQAIKKINLINGEECFWSAAPRGFVSEPIMVPNPDSEIEDEGWIFVLAWNGERRETDLVILQANNLDETAVINLPLPIPYGLHGSWANEL